MLSKRCHEAFSSFKKPVFMWVFSVLGIIPTRCKPSGFPDILCVYLYPNHNISYHFTYSPHSKPQNWSRIGHTAFSCPASGTAKQADKFEGRQAGLALALLSDGMPKDAMPGCQKSRLKILVLINHGIVGPFQKPPLFLAEPGKPLANNTRSTQIFLPASGHDGSLAILLNGWLGYASRFAIDLCDSPEI